MTSSLRLFKSNLLSTKDFKHIPNLLNNMYLNNYDISYLYNNFIKPNKIESNKIESNNIESQIKTNPYYNKILFCENKMLDCYFIFWNRNSESKIHDHSNNGCYYKLLKGNLNEYVYNTDLNIIRVNNILEDELSYIDNDIGYHKILNPENELAISVHVYSPPNYTMNSYD